MQFFIPASVGSHRHFRPETGDTRVLQFSAIAPFHPFAFDVNELGGVEGLNGPMRMEILAQFPLLLPALVFHLHQQSTHGRLNALSDRQMPPGRV